MGRVTRRAHGDRGRAVVGAAVLFGALLVVAGGVPPARAWDPLQKAARAAEQGQRAMAAGDTLAAVEALLKAQALAPEDPRIRLGLGEAFYASGEYRSSLGQFEAVAGPDRGEHLGQALYNAGNAAFGLQDFERALDLYTRALVDDPSPPREDLLHNLELTQKLLEQSEQQDSGGENQDERNEDEQEQEQSQDQQDQEQGQDQQRQQEQPQNEQEEPQSEDQQDQEQQNPPEPQESPEREPDQPEPQPETLAEGMTPEDALRLLDALDSDEEELRRSIQRRLRGDDTESEHDW